MIRSIRIGTRNTDGPAEVVAAIAEGNSETIETSQGFAVSPGVYLHRDDVAAYLDSCASIERGTGTTPERALNDAAEAIRRQVV